MGGIPALKIELTGYPVKRRNFIKGTLGYAASLGAAGSLGYSLRRRSRPKIPGRIVGAPAKFGHQLNGQIKENPPTTESVGTLIIGAGIAGLSAGWWLRRNNIKDFIILDLDESIGGNSRSGQNEISPYPWGAHYLPLPGPNSSYVSDFLQECGVITGKDPNTGKFIYDESYLCADPQERLFIQGRWQEGLVPQRGLSSEDKRQFAEFFRR